MYKLRFLCFFCGALAFVYLLLQTKINSINYNSKRKEREAKTAISDLKSLRLNAAFLIPKHCDFDVCVTVLLGYLKFMMNFFLFVNDRELKEEALISSSFIKAFLTFKIVWLSLWEVSL